MTIERACDANSERMLDNEVTIIHLTDREIEVLKLVLEGRSNKEAAVTLCCSKRTVDFHLARIYQKLDVSNRVQAMRRVADMGLFSLDSGDNGHGQQG